MNGAVLIAGMLSVAAALVAVTLFHVSRVRMARSVALGTLLAVGFLILSASVDLAKNNGLLAHDLNGFTLDMTVAQVEAVANKPLVPLGGGQYQADVEGIVYNFGFSALKHLYRIDSKQQLGSFVPDSAFANILTGRLQKKFGPPQSNQLPAGPAFWKFTEDYADGNGHNASRETESLLVLLDNGGSDKMVSVEMQLMDLRILRRDEQKPAAATT